MRRFYLLLAVAMVAVASCQKDVVYNDILPENENVELPATSFRSYDEALKIAEDALSLLDGKILVQLKDELSSAPRDRPLCAP